MTPRGSPTGDLLRAFARLRPTDAATRREIAALLGATPPDAPASSAPDAEAPAAPAREPERSVPDRPVGRPEERGRRPAPDDLVRLRAPDPDAPGAVPSVLEPDRRVALRPPEWLERAAPLPEQRGAPAEPAPPEPLLDPGWTRGILSGSLTAQADDGPPDVERVVREIARGRPLRRLPRLAWPTLARGVQLLVDRSDAMLPFAADREWLVARMRAVVGPEKLEVLDFSGCPSWSVLPADALEPVDYHSRHTPHPGATVVLLTDLGIGRPPGTGARVPAVREWLDFAERVRRAGCPLVAFVPYGPARWPGPLRQVMHLVHWDRATSARTVRRAVGRGLRVPHGARW